MRDHTHWVALLPLLLARIACVTGQVEVKTGVSWSSPASTMNGGDGSLKFKPRESVSTLNDLAMFLLVQMDAVDGDDMPVIVSFFEPQQVQGRTEGYLNFVAAGGYPGNAMNCFVLCQDFSTAAALGVPPPLPRTVSFWRVERPSGDVFVMRTAKFFSDGAVHYDGDSEVLATLHPLPTASVTFDEDDVETENLPALGGMTERAEL